MAQEIKDLGRDTDNVSLVLGKPKTDTVRLSSDLHVHMVACPCTAPTPHAHNKNKQQWQVRDRHRLGIWFNLKSTEDLSSLPQNSHKNAGHASGRWQIHYHFWCWYCVFMGFLRVHMRLCNCGFLTLFLCLFFPVYFTLFQSVFALFYYCFLDRLM